MMTTQPASAALLGSFFATLALCAPAFAERPLEPRDSASHVVTGTVQGVFRRDAGSEYQYVVRIRIEAVQKGDGYEPGDTFFAYCFQRKADAPPQPSAGGHKSIPKEDQRIRAYVHRRNGLFEGNYKDWFDVLKTEP
jgi:hypothetical protein